MARRRRMTTNEDTVELASRLPGWVARILALVSFLPLHAYAISPLLGVAGARQMGGHYLTPSLFFSLAMIGQYYLPLVFIRGAIGSAFAQYHARMASATSLRRIIEGVSRPEFEPLIREVGMPYRPYTSWHSTLLTSSCFLRMYG